MQHPDGQQMSLGPQQPPLLWQHWSFGPTQQLPWQQGPVEQILPSNSAWERCRAPPRTGSVRLGHNAPHHPNRNIPRRPCSNPYRRSTSRLSNRRGNRAHLRAARRNSPLSAGRRWRRCSTRPGRLAPAGTCHRSRARRACSNCACRNIPRRRGTGGGRWWVGGGSTSGRCGRIWCRGSTRKNRFSSSALGNRYRPGSSGGYTGPLAQPTR